MTPTATEHPHAADADRLLAAWQQARSKGLNNRAAAATLKLSEAELIASGCGRFVTRLLPDTQALLRKLPLLGEIKAVVRNPAAVIERDGTVRGVAGNAAGADLVQADHFEMICEVSQWRKAFALREETSGGLKLSLQFFTAAGTSAAKFFLRPASDVHAFAQLVAAFASSDQSPDESTEPDVAEFRLPLQRTAPVASGALDAFLQAAVQLQQALTFVTRNDAACLSTSKAIERVKRSDRGGWVNVLDDGLDIHLHEDGIRYLRPVSDADGDAGWLHWFSEDEVIALSVRCRQGWQALARSAGVER
jgi:putative hemin transport protein